jgi:hypothetical protein
MAVNVTVVCPHCGVTSSYSVNANGKGEATNGITSTNCKSMNCRKIVKINMQKGQVYSVSK